MIGFIKTIFSGLFGIIVTILKLPLTLISLPLKLVSSGKDSDKKQSDKPVQEKSDTAFYLDADEAKGFTESTSKAKTSEAKAAPASNSNGSTANALNLPAPKVTTSPSAPEPAYSQFGPRRGPGANMKSFLDMAKSVKRA